MKDLPNVSVAGFAAGAIKTGIRYRNRLDLGIIIADKPCAAVGIFTKNQIKAPSVILSKRRLKKGMAKAILANSGNANACMGFQGRNDVIDCTGALAKALGVSPTLVLMNSTGVIGEPLKTRKIISLSQKLIESARPDGLMAFAQSIMTTDTKPKLRFRRVCLKRGNVVVAGIAKGAGMIMPNMATMLGYILTDAAIDTTTLRNMLISASEDSFNALTIDGDTSTSDSLIMMASGASGHGPENCAGFEVVFQEALSSLCLELAEAIVADGEGATKWFKVLVENAANRREADKVARRVANSPLVKTAFHAGDPNWGRVMMAAGNAGVRLDQKKITMSFEDPTGSKVNVVTYGMPAQDYSESKARKILSKPGFLVRINLANGEGARTIFTCDFSEEYVRINANYRT